MIKISNASVVRSLRTLYSQNAEARQLFDRMATRQRDAKATTVDWIMRELDLNRGDAVTLMKTVADTGSAAMWQGRRGAKTRLVWSFSCVSVGQTAAGDGDELEAVHEPEAELDDEFAGTENAIEESVGTTGAPFTIADAKRLLARQLGIQESNIEISIRA